MATKKNGKTNKTAHVLNVLAGAGHEELAEPVVEEKPAPQKKPARTHTLEVAPTGDDALSQAIRDSLQTLEEAPSDMPEAATTPPTKEAPPTAEQPPLGGEETRMATEDERIEEAAPVTAPPPPPAPEPAPPPPPAPEPAPAQSAEAFRPGLDFDVGYVNIMQALVEEKAQKYIEMFKLCTCPRCVADVKALALTNLPAKYAVMEKSDMIPMLTVYEGRFSSVITAQLLKACEKVLANPRHE